ncbi:patatin-like phospholipase family protein [Umboniibacter marinipuniceus]|uniref:NTE family protein n=1 Tax=Umboniibacter marinipuniceus TaxID=569599 RepID=A0A3M0A724_9GAMM|nr:patatin-like phospholipase family protein [Umboniibacter marinipuniceus]RMA79339.1 NTE family protein [Umboniibacter marinipuniceus]
MASISLVLGSGGARGLVQIGVIDWLLDNGYEIESISGCSVGALIGGVYAAGKFEEFKSWVFELEKGDVLRLTDLHWGAGGFIKGDRVMNALRSLVGAKQIEELDIRYTAVATDLHRGQEKWFQSGDLFDAIRASIAVPNVLSPHVVNGRVYVDGGLLNPVPIAPTLADHTDMTVAVDLAARSTQSRRHNEQPKALKNTEKRGRIASFIADLMGDNDDEVVELPGVLDISNRSFDIMQTVISRTKLATHSPDVIFEFARDLSATHEFWRAKELADIGYQVAANTMKQQAADEGI